MATPKGRSEPTCTYCGGLIKEGYLVDYGDGARPLGWIKGAVRRGMMGGAKTLFETKYATQAYRCVDCGHLEIFVQNPAAGK